MSAIGLVALSVGIGATGVYLATAARTITWQFGGADGAELAAAAYVLGVPHPTGYPLYMLLGHVFTRIPVGEVAFRVTLLSVLSAAAASGLLALLAARLDGRRDAAQILGAASGGIALATSPLFWSQAVIPEVYSLHVLLSVAGLLLLAAWRPGADGVVVALAFVFGLGLAHHLTFVFLVGLATVYLVWREPRLGRRRVAGTCVLAIGAGLCFYLYIPWRAVVDPPLNWGNAVDAKGLVDHVTGRAYQGYVLSQGGELVRDRVPVLARLIGEQLTWPGLAVAVLGLIQLWRERTAFGLVLLGLAGASAVFSLIYVAAAGQNYVLPAVTILSLGLGLGVARLARDVNPPVAAGIVLVLAVWQLTTNWARLDLSQDYAAATYARQTMASAEAGALLYTDSDEHTFALWYAQAVEGLRPDVIVIDRRIWGAEWYREQLQRRYSGAIPAELP